MYFYVFLKGYDFFTETFMGWRNINYIIQKHKYHEKLIILRAKQEHENIIIHDLRKSKNCKEKSDGQLMK